MTTERLRTTKNYRQGHLPGIAFLRVDLSGCDLSRQNLTGCEFDGCDLTGASFHDAVITDVQFKHETVGLTVDQVKSTWNYKHDRMEGVRLPEEIANGLERERTSEDSADAPAD